MKKLLLLGLLALTTGIAAFADEVRVFNCVADTWIRSNNESNKNPDSDKLEIRMEGNSTDGFSTFAGLYGFNFEVLEGLKVQSATIRIVTERWKGSAVDVYGYPNDFIEASATWGTEREYINKALENEVLVTFTPKAQRSVSLGSDAVDENYRDISAWTNEIDVTNYVKSISRTATRVNFFLVPTDKTSTGQNCFYTKEVKDVTNSKDATLTFSAADLVPELYVTFVEEAGSTKVDLTPSIDAYVRGNGSNNGNEYASATEMEIYTLKDSEDKMTYFVGLMSFDLPAELLSGNYELTGASLRLVTTQCKGDRNMGIFKVNPFTEKPTWSTVGENVLEVMANEPDVKFSVKGQGNVALNGRDGISADYLTVDAWTNTLDLTELVNSVIAENSSKLFFAIAKTVIQNNNNAVKFATKENTGANGVKSSDNSTFTFPAADVVPQLTLAYSLKEAPAPVLPDAPIHTMDENDNLVETIKITTASDVDLYYYHFIYDVPAKKDDVENAGEGKNEKPRHAARISEEDPENAQAETPEYKLAVKGGDVYDVDDNGDGTKTYVFITDNLVKSTPTTEATTFADLKDGQILHINAYTQDKAGNKSPEMVLGVEKTSDDDGVKGNTSGIENVSAETVDAPAEYFNLQGIRIANPESGNIYIVRQGNKAIKVRF